MTIAKWTGHQQDSRYHAARFNEKGCLPVWAGDALSVLCGPVNWPGHGTTDEA
jgi:hypothetical protein